MNKRSHITFALLIAFLTLPLAAAARSGQTDIVWTKKQSSRTGLYTTKNYFISHGVSLNVSALYFYGDVDNIGLVFNGGFNVKNLSVGGGIGINYNLPVSNHVNLRFGINAGRLRADNTEKFSALDTARYDFRSFHSWYIQPAFGVLYYPFSQAGFYITGGIAVAASIIDDFCFYRPMPVEGSSQKTLQPITNGGKTTYGILPMVQLGLGYSWSLSKSWSLSVEFMVQEGLVDTKFMNLDAWPLDASQNDRGIDVGASFRSTENGTARVRWNDGWFQLGLTVVYQWHNCEHCRTLNNYNGVPGRRR